MIYDYNYIFVTILLIDEEYLDSDVIAIKNYLLKQCCCLMQNKCFKINYCVFLLKHINTSKTPKGVLEV